MFSRGFDPRAAAKRAVVAASEAVGDRLRGAVLYGAGAGTEFDQRYSDLNVAFVFSALGTAELEALRPAFRRWVRLRLTRPLLLSEEDLTRSLDTFPLEYLLIRERHVLLHGSDHFEALAIDRAALRNEIERLLRAQELGLNWTYLELAGTSPGAREWASRAGTSVSASASGLLHLLGEPVPETRAALMARCAARFGLDPAALSLFLARREGGAERVETARVLSAAHAILSRLIEEVERLDVSVLHPQ